VKDVYCEKCGKKVAELEPGTKIRKGTVFICRDCWEPPKKKQDYQPSLDDLRNFLGMK
jgi:ribosome-binding protein aMBF1 (putative translation factor)